MLCAVWASCQQKKPSWAIAVVANVRRKSDEKGGHKSSLHSDKSLRCTTQRETEARKSLRLPSLQCVIVMEGGGCFHAQHNHFPGYLPSRYSLLCLHVLRTSLLWLSNSLELSYEAIANFSSMHSKQYLLPALYL